MIAQVYSMLFWLIFPGNGPVWFIVYLCRSYFRSNSFLTVQCHHPMSSVYVIYDTHRRYYFALLSSRLLSCNEMVKVLLLDVSTSFNSPRSGRGTSILSNPHFKVLRRQADENELLCLDVQCALLFNFHATKKNQVEIFYESRKGNTVLFNWVNCCTNVYLIFYSGMIYTKTKVTSLNTALKGLCMDEFGLPTTWDRPWGRRHLS